MKNHMLVSIIDSLHFSSDVDVARIAHAMSRIVSGYIVKCCDGDTCDTSAQCDATNNEDPGEDSNDGISVNKITGVLEVVCLQDNSGVAISLITAKMTCGCDLADGEIYFLMKMRAIVITQIIRM